MNFTYIFILIGFVLIYGITKVTVSKRKNIYKPKKLTKAQQIEFYYSCLYNSLVLFAATPEYLESLGGPAFNPILELETEFDYAFGDFIFEQNFKNNRIKETLRSELLEFKKQVDKTPSEIWTLEKIAVDKAWVDIRTSANVILNKMGEKRREYDFDFTTVVYVDNK